MSYFERGFASLAKEFGLEMAADAEISIISAWDLLDEMYADARLNIPFSKFTGYGGLTSFHHVQQHLEDNRLRREAGIAVIDLFVSESAPFVKAIPNQYDGAYTVVPQEKITDLLETKMPGFMGVISSQKGCVNSALFCQEVLLFLLKRYPDRFSFYEHTPVHKILLHKEYATLDAETHVIDALKVVLCTNGFENMHIINNAGLDIDAKYHYLVHGKIGYMSGYLEPMNKDPIAISYYIDPTTDMTNEYFYLTRRPYEYEVGMKHNLVSLGGPEIDLDEQSHYAFEDEYPDEAAAVIDTFVRRVYDIEPNKKIDFVFTWHGLMGYTVNGVRLVGPEPQNPTLLYNLGCNGVGILPSIFGGRTTARHIAGERVKKNIFDVPRVVNTSRQARD